MSIDKTPMIQIHQNRSAMGAASARCVQLWVEEALQTKPRCRVIFGCAPSQDDLFRALVLLAQDTPELWRRVEVFHMDEYVGLPDSHPQSFRTYLREHFLNHVSTACFHAICGEAHSTSAEVARYASLIAESPIDVIALGFGENGHLAFNDPPVADFFDPMLVKVIEMDTACRQQQVNDGCFPTLDRVPRLAMTITLPVFAKAKRLCGTVPGRRKAQAVRDALLNSIGTACPATLLRTHPCAALFLDQESSSLLPENLKLPALCPN